MSEITWVLVLGSIAIIFPLILMSVSAEIETPQVDEKDWFDYDAYMIIQNMSCNDYDYTLLRENKHFFNTVGWFPTRPELVTYCFFDSDWINNWINKDLKSIDDITNPDIVKGNIARRVSNAMGLNKFFDAINTLPSGVSTFIYLFYTLLLVYLVVRAITLI